MADKTKLISKLAKSHEFFGKGKKIFDRLNYINKISQLDPKDSKAVKKFAGLADKDSQKLLKLMDARLKAVEMAARAPFPTITTDKDQYRDKFLELIDKYGPENPKTQKAQKSYLKALERYDLSLRERISYCKTVIKYATEQRKVHTAIRKHMIKTEKILTALAKLPRKDTAQTADYLFTVDRYAFVKYRAEYIAKATTKLIVSCHVNIRDVEKVKKQNDQAIGKIRKQQLQDLINKGKEFFGLAA